VCVLKGAAAAAASICRAAAADACEAAGGAEVGARSTCSCRHLLLLLTKEPHLHIPLHLEPTHLLLLLLVVLVLAVRHQPWDGKAAVVGQGGYQVDAGCQCNAGICVQQIHRH
jgi:hypothetical protein